MKKEITTKSGFTCKIDIAVLDDMELVDAMAAAQEEDPLQISIVIDKMLGDTKKALYEHCRAKDGRVPIEATTNEIVEIFEALGDEGKNS